MIGPFSLAQHLNGDDWFMGLMTDDPVVQPLIDMTTDFCIRYAQEMAKAGACCVVIIDPTASHELLGDEFYTKFAVPYHKKIADAMKAMDILTVLHICGDTTKGIHLMDQAGIDAISVDQKVNIAKAVEASKTAVIIGNLDPVQLMWKGTPDGIKAESAKIFANGSKIITLGCGTVSATPTENLQALVEYAKTSKY